MNKNNLEKILKMNIFDKVLELGETLKSQTQSRSINEDFEKILVIFLSGSIRILRSIKLLYDNSCFEDGFSLLRILLELCVDLEYIKLDTHNRAKQYIEFSKLKLNEQIDILKNLDLASALTSHFQVEVQFKNKMRWSGVSFKEMLTDITLKNNEQVSLFLLTYKYLCSFSHSSAQGLATSVVFSQEDVSVMEAKRDNLKRSLPILSCLFVLWVCSRVDEDFSLSNSTMIETMRVEIFHLAGINPSI